MLHTFAFLGVTAFDEAMGTISVGSDARPQFKLDSLFDDNFDFTAARDVEVRVGGHRGPLFVA